MKWFLLFVISSLAFKTIGQDKSIFIGGGYRGGSPFRDNRYAQIVDYAHSGEIALISKRFGNRSWERFLNEPQISIGLKYTDFGNRFLGKAVSGFYTLGIPIFKNDFFSFNSVLGTGGAFFTQKFSEDENPLNVAISTDVTFLVRFGFAAQFNFNNWLVEFRGDLDHYSVAAINQPNVGLNHYSLALLFYRRVRDSDYNKQQETFIDHRLNFIASIGPREGDGETLPHWTFNGFYSLPVFKLISISGGVSFFFNEAFQRQLLSEGVDSARSFRMGLFGGTQVNLGNVALNIHLGRYLLSSTNDEPKGYQQAIFRYYFTDHLSAAFSLVAVDFNESFTADVGLGFSF